MRLRFWAAATAASLTVLAGAGTAGAHTWGPISGEFAFGTGKNCASSSCLPLLAQQCAPDAVTPTNGVDYSLAALPSGVAGHKAQAGWSVGGSSDGNQVKFQFTKASPCEFTEFEPRDGGTITIPGGAKWVVVTAAPGASNITWSLRGVAH